MLVESFYICHVFEKIMAQILSLVEKEKFMIKGFDKYADVVKYVRAMNDVYEHEVIESAASESLRSWIQHF